MSIPFSCVVLYSTNIAKIPSDTKQEPLPTEFNRYFPRNRHPFRLAGLPILHSRKLGRGKERGEKEKRRKPCSFRNERRPAHARRREPGSARPPSRVDSNLNCIIRSSRLASHVELKICSFPGITCWDSLTGWLVDRAQDQANCRAFSLSLSLPVCEKL